MLRIISTCSIIVLSALLPIEHITAEPSVIHDGGGFSTFEYRQALRSESIKVPDFGGQWVQQYTPIIARDPENTSLWLPLRSSLLSPKRLTENKRVNYPDLDAPICIIGSDELSRAWLRKYADALVQARARCWLVQADNFRDFSAISNLLNGKVLMMPADGNAIAEFFGIQHYPVFIDQQVIAQ